MVARWRPSCNARVARRRWRWVSTGGTIYFNLGVKHSILTPVSWARQPTRLFKLYGLTSRLSESSLLSLSLFLSFFPSSIFIGSIRGRSRQRRCTACSSLFPAEGGRDVSTRRLKLLSPAPTRERTPDGAGLRLVNDPLELSSIVPSNQTRFAFRSKGLFVRTRRSGNTIFPFGIQIEVTTVKNSVLVF